jgi:hypothetical protein
MKNHDDDNQLHDLLRQAIPPETRTDLGRDLWSQMLQRLEYEQTVRVPWFDWALAVLISAAFLLFPGVIPALLYHL